MKRLFLAVSLLAALLPRPCAAGSAGREPFNFLFLDAGARAVAMGGAYTALADDANALLYNPAGLGRLRAHEATFMGNQYAENVTQEYIAFAARQGWGLSVNRLSFGSIQRTTISDPDGSSAYGITDLAVSGGYGRSFGDSLSLGAGVKYIREAIDDVSAAGYAADLGALYTPALVPGLSLGLAVQNMGPAVKFQRAKENLPLNARLGAAYALRLFGRKAVFSADATKERSEELLFGAGAESFLNGVMALRLGYSSRNDAGTGVTLGLGWIYERFRFDYAFVPLGELGNAHRLSLTLRWGGPGALEQGAQSSAKDWRCPDQESGRPCPKEPAVEPADAHFKKAERFIVARSLEAAKKELSAAAAQLKEQDPRWVRYFACLGSIFFLEKDPAAKPSFIEALRRAESLGVKDTYAATANMGMGLCLLKEGNRVYAEKFLRKALDLGLTEDDADLARRKLQDVESSP